MAGDKPRSDAPRDEMRADTDGDGRVSRAEATTAGAERSGEWFDKLDLNKDGYVTQEEMQPGARNAPRRTCARRRDERFKEADSTATASCRSTKCRPRCRGWRSVSRTLDTDKNGFLSKDELQRPRHQPRDLKLLVAR